MKLTEHQAKDYPEKLQHLEAVARLANANFPRETGLRIETAGSQPKASITLPWYFVQFLINSGRAALQEGKE